MNGMYGGGMGAGGWLLMSIVWIALVVSIVWAAVHLLPRREHSEPSGPARLSSSREDDPLAILDRRLARGEIDVETYDELRKRLGAGSSREGK